VQLTWKEQQAIVWDKELRPLHKISFETTTGEGWGITTDSRHLIVSDGSSQLDFWDSSLVHGNDQGRPARVVKSINVRDKDSKPITMINELEWFRGSLLANVWYTKWILQIDPSTGRVLSFWDFSCLPLAPHRRRTDGSFNGIATVDERRGEVLVTGKNWGKMYHVRLHLP